VLHWVPQGHLVGQAKEHLRVVVVVVYSWCPFLNLQFKDSTSAFYVKVLLCPRKLTADITNPSQFLPKKRKRGSNAAPNSSG
tara:strand:- start:32 stop:277 length:246 start_codon:yes stop_codon:yes gene_type:complete